MTLLWSFIAGWCGAVLWHLVVMLRRRSRYVVVTREMVVKHPDVEWLEPLPPRIPDAALGGQNGGSLIIQAQDTGSVAWSDSSCEIGELRLKPVPARKHRKPSRRERALRALAGASE